MSNISSRERFPISAGTPPKIVIFTDNHNLWYEKVANDEENMLGGGHNNTHKKRVEFYWRRNGVHTNTKIKWQHYRNPQHTILYYYAKYIRYIFFISTKMEYEYCNNVYMYK